MKATNFLLGLAPWFLFSFVAERLGPDGVGYGAALACAGSLVLAVLSRRRGGPNVIEVAGVVTFGFLAAVSAVVSDPVRQDIANYGRGGAAVLLAVVMLISAYTVPFTESIARERVAPRVADTAAFRALNRRLSLLWAGLIAVMAVSHLVAGVFSSVGDQRPIINLALNWAVPVLIVVKGLKLTEQIVSAELQTHEDVRNQVVGGAA